MILLSLSFVLVQSRVDASDRLANQESLKHEIERLKTEIQDDKALLFLADIDISDPNKHLELARYCRSDREKTSYITPLPAIIWAASHCHQDSYKKILSLLLRHGANPNAESPDDKITPLIIAAMLKQSDVIQELIDHGALVNYIDSRGWTPLDYVYYGSGFVSQTTKISACVLSNAGGQLGVMLRPK